MKPLIFALCVVFGGLNPQQSVWQPSLGQTQVPIWPGAAPETRANGVARVETMAVDKNSVAGRPWVEVSNVSRPTMTVYAPKGKNTGAAVVVFPGGGYKILAIDLEGTEVCDWLSSRGITCVLLKYRVPDTGPYPESDEALQDAQRAVGMVRAQAAEWKIDPKRVGVLGFSAGGHLAAAVSTHYETRLYPKVDAADELSCRPDFAVVVYPGYLALADKGFAFTSDIPVTKEMPPTFLLNAEDAPVHVMTSTAYFLAS